MEEFSIKDFPNITSDEYDNILFNKSRCFLATKTYTELNKLKVLVLCHSEFHNEKYKKLKEDIQNGHNTHYGDELQLKSAPLFNKIEQILFADIKFFNTNIYKNTIPINIYSDKFK
jgi:hypothetical protein